MHFFPSSIAFVVFPLGPRIVVSSSDTWSVAILGGGSKLVDIWGVVFAIAITISLFFIVFGLHAGHDSVVPFFVGGSCVVTALCTSHSNIYISRLTCNKGITIPMDPFHLNSKLFSGLLTVLAIARGIVGLLAEKAANWIQIIVDRLIEPNMPCYMIQM